MGILILPWNFFLVIKKVLKFTRPMRDLAGNVDIFHVNSKRTRRPFPICTDILLPWHVLRAEARKQQLIEGLYNAEF